MSLSIISPKNKKEEKAITDYINKCISDKTSILFNSGAGSGKTYALVQGIKYAIDSQGEKLKSNNQKIMCITYTNVATREIEERLGNTSMVIVSTIHERIWELIKTHKKQLLEIHKNYLEREVIDLERFILEDSKYQKYKELSDEQKVLFNNIIIENRDLYYKVYSYKANDFKNEFNGILGTFSELLKNVKNFKAIVNTVFKISNYKKCIENIDKKKSGYTSVIYDSNYNTDRLHRMRISHNTLLKYGFEIINKYDLLKQMIIDKYPLIFIDEFQDTDSLVVKIMNCLNQYANKIGREIFIGYFGDSAQNIYENGVGKKILDIHENLEKIDKNFNRRSTQEVINIANKIRNDDIIQKSIYDDCTGGSVKFYTGKEDDVNEFINKYMSEWKIEKNNPLNCLVLTNKTVAKYMGFEEIYSVFSKCEIYEGKNYSQLNTELLSEDIAKLGEIPSLLFRIINLNKNIKNKKSQVVSSIPYDICVDMNWNQLKDIIELVSKIPGETLNEYITEILKEYRNNVDGVYKSIIDRVFDIENISMEVFKNYLIEKLFPNNNSGTAEDIIQELLDISMDKYRLWYEYIINNSDEKLIYHTCHSTKGLEFDNVIIIMENAFGRDKNYFNYFFEKYNCSSLSIKEMEKFEKIKNLIYVSITRAIKNLRILYIDDVENFKYSVENIFEKVYEYSK